MRDLPGGPDLLALARSVLLDELLPLLPPERRLDARLVAAAMAIAEREARAGAAPVAAIDDELQALYPAADAADLLRRFALALRAGAFEGTPQECAARDLMWHMTRVKLREGNPRFLAANGFA
jgi:hypothetical protein